MEQRQVEITRARLLFRFLVGGGALAADWLGSALRALDDLPEPSGGPPVEAAQRGAHTVLVGALSSAMRWRPQTAHLEAASRHTSRATRVALRVLAHAPGAGLVERQTRELRDGLTTRVRQWAEEGAREELAGRRLARLAAPGFFELAVARMAQSPELRTVIEEQSQGLAETSVAELRARSELADRLVDRLVRRVLRRSAKAEPDVVAAPPGPQVPGRR